MKLIHCADLHLDSRLNANLSKESSKERNREILSGLVRLVDYAKENKVTAILIAGDLFDTKNTLKSTKSIFAGLIADNPDILFFYLRGNHDEFTPLNIFDEIPSNLCLFNEEWTDYALDEVDRIHLHGVELNKGNGSARQLNFSPDPSKVNIVMLHGQESETSGNDKTEVINLKQFRNKGIDYMALGHVHGYKREVLDGRGVYCYCGCLEGRGFDETGDHGFVLLDIDEEKGIIKDTFIPFATRKLYEIDADITGHEDSAETVGIVEKAVSEFGAKSKDLIKVVITGEISPEYEVDTELVRHRLKDDFYFVKVYDRTLIKVDPAKFLHDSSLKGEYVRTVLADESLTEEEKGEIIRIGLNALSGGKIEL